MARSGRAARAAASSASCCTAPDGSEPSASITSTPTGPSAVEMTANQVVVGSVGSSRSAASSTPSDQVSTLTGLLTEASSEVA